jgi:hypothetical protein
MKLMAAATASAGLIANFKDEEAVASGTGWVCDGALNPFIK